MPLHFLRSSSFSTGHWPIAKCDREMRQKRNSPYTIIRIVFAVCVTSESFPRQPTGWEKNLSNIQDWNLIRKCYPIGGVLAKPLSKQFTIESGRTARHIKAIDCFIIQSMFDLKQNETISIIDCIRSTNFDFYWNTKLEKWWTLIFRDFFMQLWNWNLIYNYENRVKKTFNLIEDSRLCQWIN